VRFFCDHDVPADVARVLRQEGHEVTELRAALPVNASDAEVLRYAQERELLLVTCNRDDFLALASEQPGAGLIILIRRRTRQAECAHLLALLARAGENGLRGNINFA
jgi:predicted nuclease of predicted toxin-antitoxin system